MGVNTIILPFMYFLMEFSHKLMSKIQPVVTRSKNTIRKERAYDVISIQRETKRQWYKKYSEKATSPNKQKKKIYKLQIDKARDKVCLSDESNCFTVIVRCVSLTSSTVIL